LVLCVALVLQALPRVARTVAVGVERDARVVAVGVERDAHVVAVGVGRDARVAAAPLLLAMFSSSMGRCDSMHSHTRGGAVVVGDVLVADGALRLDALVARVAAAP
jgi:hypothetical protein